MPVALETEKGAKRLSHCSVQFSLSCDHLQAFHPSHILDATFDAGPYSDRQQLLSDFDDHLTLCTTCFDVSQSLSR